MGPKATGRDGAGFPDRLSLRRQHLLSLAILAVLPLLLFFSTTLGGKQFMGHDTIQWRAGAESIFEYRAAHDGEEPLWASNMFAGMPAYTVHVFKSVPHLDNMVFDRLRMIWPAVPYWVLLGGLYLFFTLLGARPLTAALGALFFGLTTYLPIIIGAGHNIKFIAYSYIPWMLSGYWLLSRTERRGLGFLLFAVAATLEFRAGHPQVTYYFVYLFAALFLYDAWRHYAEKRLNDWGRVTLLLTVALLLGLLGTAEQYWRLMEYSPHSIRGGSALAEASGGGLDLEYAFSWSQGILESLTLLVPNLYGGSSAMAYWGEKPGTSGPHYFGAVAFLLFLIGLLRSRRWIRLLFAGVGLLALTFSWGYHFPLNELWFHILPGFDKFRTPEMWLTLTVFSFGVVACFGAEYLIESGPGKKTTRTLYLPGGIALGAGVLLLVAAPLLLSFESERERTQIARQIAAQSELSPDNRQVQQRTTQIIESRLKPERVDLARSDTLRYLLLAGAAAAMIHFFLGSKIGGGALLLSLILLTVFDLTAAGKRYIGEHSLVDRSLELTRVIESQGNAADRFVRERIHTPEGVPQRVLPLDENPFNNAVPSYFYPSIGGYSGAKLSIFQDLIDEGLFTGPAGVNLAALDMLHVRYITARRPLPLPGYEEVFHEGEHYVYENPAPLQRAWFVDRVETVSTPREAFDAILPQAGFRPFETAIVETGQEISVTEDPGARVEITSWSDRRMEFRLQRDGPGFLVVSEIYYEPGWQAFLNGEPVPIRKTNYLLRGVEIPSGSHVLRMEFHPRSHITGSGISWAANLVQWLTGLLLLGIWLRKGRKGNES